MERRIRQVSLEDVGVQVLFFSATDGLDEVGLVGVPRLATGELLHLLAVLVVHPPAAGAPDVIPAFAIHHDADPRPPVVVHRRVARLSRQAAHFEDDRRRLVVDERNLRIRRLGVVVVDEPPADAHRPRRRGRVAARPPAHVHLVNALVPDVPVSRVPEPVPIVMQPLAHQRFLRRRAAPQVVIHFRRDGRRPRHLADAAARLVTEPAQAHYLPQVPRTDPFERFPDARVRPVLRPALHDPIVFPRRLHRLAAHPDIVRDRLLNVHVLARLAAPDHDERVPVVRRRRHHAVHVLVVEHPPHILVRRHLNPLSIEPGHLPVEHLAVAIAQGCNPHPFHAGEHRNVRFAATAESHDGHADILVRPEDSRIRPAEQHRPRRYRPRQELPALHPHPPSPSPKGHRTLVSPFSGAYKMPPFSNNPRAVGRCRSFSRLPLPAADSAAISPTPCYQTVSALSRLRPFELKCAGPNRSSCLTLSRARRCRGPPPDSPCFPPAQRI